MKSILKPRIRKFEKIYTFKKLDDTELLNTYGSTVRQNALRNTVLTVVLIALQQHHTEYINSS